jgi:hypothetical protein
MLVVSLTNLISVAACGVGFDMAPCMFWFTMGTSNCRICEGLWKWKLTKEFPDNCMYLHNSTMYVCKTSLIITQQCHQRHFVAYE